MSSSDRLNDIKAKIPANVKIVAVSKTKPADMIHQLYRETDQRDFGENKVQELGVKQGILPGDIIWHFVGHLQTNKIKYIAPYIGLIHSVDSFRLLREINKEAKRCNRAIPCLLQFHIAMEETKFGFSMEEAIQMLENEAFSEMSNVSVSGVMGMATFTKDELQIRKEFKQLYGYFKSLKAGYFATKPEFREISMGMTDDYLVAINEGSTIVRIGSGIFGVR